MMRKNSHEEDLERRKTYLTRSLPYEMPLLSPVPEEGESSVSLPSPKTCPRPAISKESIARPYSYYSPLPPLIIEKEQTISKHDEPEEFYVKLEKKIMKIYRRLFIENRSDVSDISEDVDTSMPGTTYCNRRASFGETNGVNDELRTDDADVLLENNIVSVFEAKKKIDGEKINDSLKGDLPKDDLKTTDNGWSNFTLTKNDLFLGKYLTEDSMSSSTEILPRSTSEDSQTDEDEEMVSSVTKSPIYSYDSDVSKVIQNETVMSQRDVENEEEELTSEHPQILSNYTQEPLEVERTTVLSDSSADVSCRQITFEADVHRDATGIIVEKIPTFVYDYEQNIRQDDISDKNLDEIYKYSAEMEKRKISDNGSDASSGGNEVNSAELEKQKISDMQSDTSPEDDEHGNIEVMRTPRIHTSVGSLQSKHDDNHCSDTEMKITSRSLEAHSESESSKESDPTEADDEESIDYDILNTSVGIDGRQSKNAVKRKSSSPLLPSPAKHPRYKNAEVQANYRDIIVEWNRYILSKSIFRGVPYVYRL